jgi:hypothetical protein
LRLRSHDSKTGEVDLGLLRKPKADAVSNTDNENWVTLIENVGSLQIRYFDPRLNSWVPRWTDTVMLPRLVKVVIGRPNARVPLEMIVALARTPL